MNDEKLSPIEAALASALRLNDRQAYEKALQQICENGMKAEEIECQQPSTTSSN